MNHSSFNRRNLKPRKNNIKTIISHISHIIKTKNNRVLVNGKNTTKKAFRNPNKVAGFTAKEIKKTLIKAVYFLSLLLVFLFISWFLFSSPFFKIKHVSINIENKKYIESLNAIIDNQKQQKKIFWKQNNLFLFDKNDLVYSINKISDGFFYNISIDKSFPNKLNINLKERSPKIVFITDEYRFYFDNEGKMILKSKVNKSSNNVVTPPTSSPKTNNVTAPVTTPSSTDTKQINTNKDSAETDDILKELIKNQEDTNKDVNEVNIENNKILSTTTTKTLNTTTDVPVKVALSNDKIKQSFSFSNKEDVFKDYRFPEVYLGQKIELKDYDFSKDTILFINKLDAKLSNKSIKIKKIYLETINDLKLVVTTEVGYNIYFNTSQDIDQQIDYLGIVIKDKIKEGINKIRYIDLRFGSKVYYK